MHVYIIMNVFVASTLRLKIYGHYSISLTLCDYNHSCMYVYMLVLFTSLSLTVVFFSCQEQRLFAAAVARKADEVATLLGQGFDIDCKDKVGRTSTISILGSGVTMNYQ